MSFLIRILLALIAVPAWGQPAPIVVGAAVSQTGALAVLAADYRKALLLWQDEVNALGGLLGRRVELRLLDDESDARRSGELYAELIRGKADLLIGPYGSAATLMASAQTERARRVLINGAGPALAVHKRSPRYLFQSTFSNSAYGVGVVEVAKAAGLSSAFILARNDHSVQEMSESTRERAVKQGLDAGDVQTYGAGDSNFASFIYKGSADAWIVFGEPRDSADVLRSLKKLGYAPRLFFARGAADPRFVRMVGQDAEFALAAKEYDPKFRTLGNQQFSAAFEARWSAPPTFAAAQGYAAGTVLAEAVRRTKSLDQAKLRDVLAEMETDTVLGGYKVDPETGEQRAARPAVVQIQRGKPEVIWPEWLQSSTLQPYPPWSERKLIE
ncbi:MAG TPA: amino acid ABC transporter substrate-binding protein [Burkholderiales bacterium]|nr:amino acid ABC transporter substrate-binding protein [Burkholderiales bacterium]